MKAAAKIVALIVFAGALSFSSVASAQDAPPPPPPPPSGGGEATPPPAAPNTQPPAQPHVQPHAQPPGAYPHRCGVYPAPPCYRPRYYRPRYYRPRFRRLGFYLGAGAGAFGILGAKGPYDHISAGGYGSAWLGWMIGGRFALELGFIGSVHSEEFTQYDSGSYATNEMFMWGVTLDAKYNLVRPGWRRRFIPYLQAGIGAYGLVGDNYDEYGYYSGSSGLATGGGFQLGGGLDIYLTRWLTLGARVLYRGIVFGKLRCGNTTNTCNDAEEVDTSTVVHGLTGELNMSIVF